MTHKAQMTNLREKVAVTICQMLPEKACSGLCEEIADAVLAIAIEECAKAAEAQESSVQSRFRDIPAAIRVLAEKP